MKALPGHLFLSFDLHDELSSLWWLLFGRSHGMDKGTKQRGREEEEEEGTEATAKTWPLEGSRNDHSPWQSGCLSLGTRSLVSHDEI